MATQVQFRRGTTTQNNAFTGAIGEITYDTEIKTLRLHDGSNAGGGAIVVNTASAQTLTNKTLSTGSVWTGNAVALAYGGTGAALTAVNGGIAYSTGSALALSSAGTSGQVLTSGGAGAPTWVNAASITAGTATNATYATNINGGSAGQLVIQQDTGLTTFITAGASGTFLRSAGAGYAPTWATADVTVGSTVIALGSASTSIAGLTAIDATSGATSFFATPTSPALFAAGTAVQVGATTGTLTLRNPTVVGSATTQNLYNTVATTLNIGGAATTLTIGATTGTATIRNATVAITNAATIGSTLGVTGATTLSSTLAVTSTSTFTGATTHNGGLGATSGTFSTTLAVTGATTLTGALAANGGITVDGTAFVVADGTGNTSIAGTLAVTGNQTNTGDLAVNGGDITTTATTATIFNTNATTVDAFEAATTLNMGATSGNTTIQNNLVVGGNLTINGTTTTVNATNLAIDDNIIRLAEGNAANTVDIGFVGNYTSGSALHTGLIKQASTGRWLLVSGIAEPGNTVVLTGATYDALQIGGLTATTGSFSAALTYGGVTLSNAVTGTGNMVLSAAPTFTGTANFAVIAASGDITSPNFYSVSDQTLKSNIEDSPYGLAEVMNLRSVQYDMDGRHEVGLLAQNVEQHMPEFVTTGADGIKKLDYAKMVSVLVKTVQEQQAQIEELKAKLGN